MAGSDTGEKTEAPTAQKLKELRKHNTARRSQDLPSAVSLIALVMSLPVLAKSLFTALLTMMKMVLSSAGTVDEHQAVQLLGQAAWMAFQPVLGPVLLVCASIAVTHAGYTRQKPNPAALKPQFKSLNPKQGFKRIFSTNSLVELAKGIAKLAVVSAASYGAWHAGVDQLLTQVSSVEAFASTVGGSVRSILTRVALAALIIGVADAAWQSKRYNKEAKMSLYDVKQEHKKTEGDPLIKSQIRQRGQALTRNAMVAAAAEADVIVVNPTHIAVALKYSADMPAPKVIAKGAGHVAARIRQVAEEAGVPVRRDVPLARALHKSVDVGQWIPAELYAAAAKLLAEVFKTRRKPGTGS